ncbi:hypothetical protein H0H81_006074 [Sphagnurus paluster]|uniref:DUF6699 domain-containing protein n=1 Tax=Sphagnurus paluster TaxID=117069 RepID=A0A9P7FXP8_9AGAR|nr:hypothetical protein H0H81_006074 [Sphagnurus paluster]
MTEISPFIPGLPQIPGVSPGQRANGHSPALQSAPVIPDPPGPVPAGWASTPQYPGSYPHFPNSPYTGPGFIPSMVATPAAPPAQYLPSFYPPAGRPHPSPHQNTNPNDYMLPNGLSSTYTGYPNGAPPGSGPASAHHTPAPAPSAPLYPQNGWGGHPMMQPYPPHPYSAGPYGGFYPAPYPGTHPAAFQNPNLPPPGWGQPTPAGHMGGFDAWGAQHHTPAVVPAPGWPAQMGMAPPLQHPPAAPPPARVAQIPEHFRTQSARVGDRMDPFTAGKSYGPVLEPFLLKVVGAQLRLNPLIEPLPESGADRPHLLWNMLFDSGNIQRSTDPSDVSWSNGRDEPATFPRVTMLRVVSEIFPWLIEVHASDAAVGVTCGELIDTLSTSLQTLTPEGDFNALPPARQQEVTVAYSYNRSRNAGVPGGRLKRGLRRCDFLCKQVIFGGIVADEAVVKKIVRCALPCTVVLKCARQYALTPEDVRQQDERQRKYEEGERRKQQAAEEAHAAAQAHARRRSATVETVTDSSTDDD